MKKIIELLTVIAVLMLSLVNAQAVTIYDAYWGGVVQRSGATTYGDVIGYPEFAVDKIDVTVSGSQMTVTLSGNYFKTGEVYSWGPGDLYISTSGWKTMDGQSSGHHEKDRFEKSEGWNYVVSYTAGKVYNLNFDHLVYSNTSGHTGTWIYRDGQAYRGGYGPEVTQLGDIYGVSLIANAGTLTFNFPISGIPGYDNWPHWGFHWNMQCGNDVVEGTPTPVPEPSTMLLLGSGLLAFVGFRKRFKKSV